MRRPQVFCAQRSSKARIGEQLEGLVLISGECIQILVEQEKQGPVQLGQILIVIVREG